MASIDGFLHSSGTCGHPLDLWRRIAEQQVSLALVPSFDRLPNNLHVLLRHHLLHQAHGLEGLGAIEKCANMRQLVAVKVVHTRPRRLDLHAAAASPPLNPTKHKYAVIAEGAEFIRDDAK